MKVSNSLAAADSSIMHSTLNILRKPDAMKFNGNNALSWRNWKEDYGIYIEAAGLETQSEKQRYHILLNLIGRPALDIYNTFTWDKNEKKTLESIIKKFDEVFLRDENLTFERYKFNICTQAEDQTIDDYVIQLKQKANTCQFGQLKDSLIKDRLIVGINNKQLKEKLLAIKDLTLREAHEMCSITELAAKQTEEMENCYKIKVEKVSKRSILSKEYNTAEINTEEMKVNLVHQRESISCKNRRKCKYCGFVHDKGKENCPSFGKLCYNCNRLDHFAKVCMRKNKADDATIEEYRKLKPKSECRSDDIQYKRKDKPKNGLCKYCGDNHNYGSSFCPAFGTVCKICKKENHYARVCNSLSKYSAREVSSKNETDSEIQKIHVKIKEIERKVYDIGFKRKKKKRSM